MKLLKVGNRNSVMSAKLKILAEFVFVNGICQRILWNAVYRPIEYTFFCNHFLYPSSNFYLT